MRTIAIILLLITSFTLQARDSVLEQLGFAGSDEPLAVDDAFRFSADVRDPRHLHIGWQIADVLVYSHAAGKLPKVTTCIVTKLKRRLSIIELSASDHWICRRA